MLNGNMKNHDEIFYLSNIYKNKVDSKLNDLISKSYEILNNLSNYYIYCAKVLVMIWIRK